MPCAGERRQCRQHRAAHAFRRQCRRQRPGAQAGAAGCRHHAGDRLLQDLHHAGNHGQCRHRARLVPAAGCIARGPGAPFRGGLDQPRRRGRVRHRPGQYVPVLGLGGRSLFAVVGGGPVDRRGGGLHALPRTARRRACDGPAFRQCARSAEPAAAAGPARCLVSQLPRRRQPLRGALLRAAGTAACLPAAAGDGKQWQVGAARRRQHPGRLGAGGVGHDRHQRPARLFPDDAPGLAAGSGRFHRHAGAGQRPARAPYQAAGQLLRAGRGAAARTHRGRSAGRGRQR
ncbi:hypothetical protein D3C81_1202240 [compost metagenome]